MSRIFHILWIALAIAGLTCTPASAQVFYNNGAQITVTLGGNIIVKTNSLLNDSGRIDNAGTITVEEDLTNNDTITGSGGATALFEVGRDWFNNAEFTADMSQVDMNGMQDQVITGTVQTFFYNLRVSGTGVKRLSGINEFVDNELDLTDVEMATDFDTLFVLNPNSNAVVRTSGFVSSLGNGRFSRRANSTDIYLMPTGSSVGTPRYRPVELTPTNTLMQEFHARLVNNDATVDGWDRSMHTEDLCNINPLFYHVLQRTVSDPTDMRFFFRFLDDGEWSRVAKWSAPNLWATVPDATPGAVLGFETMTKTAWDDFNPPYFALAAADPLIDAGPNVDLNVGESVQLDAIYFGPPPDTFQWTPAEGLDCDFCEDPVAMPGRSTMYTLRVVNNLGCVSIDSVLVRVFADEALFPTGFTPDGDGRNDVFRPLNPNLEDVVFRVFTRWGESVFESNDATIGWDGTYKGDPMPIGSYMFHAEFSLGGDGTGREGKQELTGNVTLLR